jgi:hypothetical protein
MKLIEFKSVDNSGKEFTVFINPEYIESVFSGKDINSTGIGLISGNSFEVIDDLETVKEKLDINIEGTAYKRIDKSH